MANLTEDDNEIYSTSTSTSTSAQSSVVDLAEVTTPNDSELNPL
jgi:hypothetical protein